LMTGNMFSPKNKTEILTSVINRNTDGVLLTRSEHQRRQIFTGEVFFFTVSKIFVSLSR
jgi:hypothetical protein